MGKEQYKFIFTLEREVRESRWCTIVEDPELSKLFKFNDRIAEKVTKLVAQMIRGEVMEFPTYGGDFGTRDQGLARQKPFDDSYLMAARINTK